jgi:hypothetical protein
MITGNSGDFTALKGIIFACIMTGLIFTIIFLLYKYVYLPSNKKIPTTANMTEILNDQKKALQPLYERIDRYEPLKPLVTNQNFIINYHSLGQTNAGYIGPYINGVIDPLSAIPLALANGARAFIIDIEDKMERPMVIVRDAAGVKLSLNDVELGDILNAIAKNAFKDTIEGRANKLMNDPCVIYIRTSGKIGIACTTAIANAFYRIKSDVLSQNEKGDFTYGKNENALFLLRPEDVSRKIIVVTNDASLIATSKTTINGKPNAGYYIHGRVWRHDMPDAGSSIEASLPKNIYEFDYSYLRGLNDRGINDLKITSRIKYFFATGKATKADIEKAKEYGVQAICGFSFENKDLQELFAKGGFPKNTDLRYIVPDPIKITEAPKEMNSNGGIIKAPTI